MMVVRSSVAVVIFAVAFIFQVTSAFVHRSVGNHDRRLALAAKNPKDPDIATKASWYAVEAFGKIFGSKDATAAGSAQTVFALDQPPATMKETQERVRKDNERAYFLSGEADWLIYSEDCTFADPFVSFQGRDRFMKNLANLGSFITEYSARLLDYRVEENAVTTKFMVKLQLNLPWKPVLAWPWGVRCEIDPETNLIVRHEESVCSASYSRLHLCKSTSISHTEFANFAFCSSCTSQWDIEAWEVRNVYSRNKLAGSCISYPGLITLSVRRVSSKSSANQRSKYKDSDNGRCRKLYSLRE
jgi:hypothetical protein